MDLVVRLLLFGVVVVTANQQESPINNVQEAPRHAEEYRQTPLVTNTYSNVRYTDASRQIPSDTNKVVNVRHAEAYKQVPLDTNTAVNVHQAEAYKQTPLVTNMTANLRPVEVYKQAALVTNVTGNPRNTGSFIVSTMSQNISSLNDSAEQRLFGNYGHHPPNCPNHPHPPPNFPIRCGGVYTGERTVLQSPGFPRPYPSHVDCTYHVVPVAPIAEACFQVRFAHLALRWSHNCQIDWIQIDQGPRLCGGISGDRFYRTSHRGLLVEFHSGAIPGPDGSGFHLIVSQVPCFRPNTPPPYLPPHHPPPHHPPPGHQCPPNHPHHPPHHSHQPPNYPHHPPNHPHHPPNRPPIYHPPPHKPILKPHYKPHGDDDLWWKWLWVLKCEWGGAEYLPPGKCPPPHVPQPQPPIYKPHGPGPRTPYIPPPRTYTPPPTPYTPYTPGPPRPPPGPGCNRVTSASQFLISSDEWLPRQAPLTDPWTCQLTVVKATPAACELYLELVGVSLRCESEYLLVGGQRVCGSQPLRQMNVDFRGSEIRIIYHNSVGGSSQHGRFEIRGYQSFDCEPFVLDVTPVKKVLEAPTTTPLPSIVPRAAA